jgi:hypothetical protein
VNITLHLNAQYWINVSRIVTHLRGEKEGSSEAGRMCGHGEGMSEEFS